MLVKRAYDEQNIPQNMQILISFHWVIHVINLPIFFRITLLALSDFFSASRQWVIDAVPVK